MVFQNYALYPHMSVYKNLAFGLKLRRYAKDEIDGRVREAAEILDIHHLLERKPKALSGGQRQRVAVGRAIVRKPKAFLFDEPLSNLDAKMRVQTRMEISKLHARLSSTMIYVTHDQIEAMTMGDRIVVMKDGYIQQVAKPLDLYNRPANLFVAGFIGSPPMNFFNGTITQQSGGLAFSCDNFAVQVNDRATRVLDRYIGKKVVFGIRPEDISDALYVMHPNPSHQVKARVEVIEPMGSETYLYLRTGNNPMVARLPPSQSTNVNQEITLAMNMDKAHFFDAASGQSIS